MARRLTTRRREWLAALGEMYWELGGNVFARVLYDALLADLRAQGVHWRTAVRVALRRARLAVYLLDGWEQQVAARELGVEARTGKSDAQAIRRAVELWRARRTLERAPAERVPLMPEDLTPERRWVRR